ncbi:MAG: hypothetical protein KPEEDBHJ_03100 [Anaerolineales bacterium]|nr:hypothetical protein [Anaerolineales bacterium]
MQARGNFLAFYGPQVIKFLLQFVVPLFGKEIGWHEIVLLNEFCIPYRDAMIKNFRWHLPENRAYYIMIYGLFQDPKRAVIFSRMEPRPRLSNIPGALSAPAPGI